jgi:hypothetical protein
MPEQLDLFDAGNGGDQSAQSTSVRQFAVTRRKLASEPGVSQFASSPTPSIWRGGNGEHTPPSPAGIKPTQFADSEHYAAADCRRHQITRVPALSRPVLVIANLGGVVLGQATPEQNTAYRTGRCTDCRTVRYSAGRPRCNGCHAAYLARSVTASGDA